MPTRRPLRTIAPERKGQSPIAFHEGGLHASTSTPSSQRIPAVKHAEAESGTLGPKAKRQEDFFRNVLKR